MGSMAEGDDRKKYSVVNLKIDKVKLSYLKDKEQKNWGKRRTKSLASMR